MSEVGWYRSQVRIPSVEAYASNLEQNPSFEILRRAMEIVAREHGGRVSDTVDDSYGRNTACDLAVSTPEFPRGVGVKVDRRTGQATFLYDLSGGQRQVAQGIADDITQNYVAICFIRAMKSLGYEVKEEPAKGSRAKAVILTGVM